MPLSSGSGISLAAAITTLSVDVLIHPIDTLITRIQSLGYKTHYKNANGSFNRSLFQGLYQGFGPTLVVGMPSAAAFFTIYEGLKTASQNAKAAGYLANVPLPILHGASSAAADLVVCAIINPAEVLKQNAQVYNQGKGPQKHRSPTMKMLKLFMKRPARLWTGYTALAASSIPGTCVTFCLYEALTPRLLEELNKKNGQRKDSLSLQIQAHALGAAFAGAFSSLLFVPVDVVKTRMRLAAGGQTPSPCVTVAGTIDNRTGIGGNVRPRVVLGPFSVARDVFRTEGVRGLYRGGSLTCVAASIGSGLGLGCYEGLKQHFKGSTSAREEALL